MKNANRATVQPHSPRRERRRPENAAERRFVAAWGDENARMEEEALRSHASPWRRVRDFSRSRTGRIVMLAPLGALGALGAYLLLRRARKS